MNIDERLVAGIVNAVLSRMGDGADSSADADGGSCGVFESMDEAVEAAAAAQKKYLNCTMHDRAAYVQAIRDVVLDQENLSYLSRQSVEETEMGNYEHKLIKNRLAATKTPGIEDLTTEAMSGDDG